MTKLSLRYRFYFFLAVMIATVCFSGFYLTKVQAQSNAIDLTVSPPTAYVKVKPGAKVTHTIIIQNNSLGTVHLTPRIIDFRPRGQTGQVIISQFLTFPYFKLPAGGLKPIDLAAQQKAKISLVIQPPKDAVTKEYPLVVLFQASPTQSNQKETAVSGTVASNLIVLVSRQSQFKPQLKIKKIQSARLIDSFQPLKFTVLAENKGVEAQIASGSATIFNWRQQPVAHFQLFPTSILGLSARPLKTIALTQPQKQEQAPVTTNQFVTRKRFWLGYYTIKIKLNQGETANETVIALPYSLLLLGLAGLAVFIGYNSIRKWFLH